MPPRLIADRNRDIKRLHQANRLWEHGQHPLGQRPQSADIHRLPSSTDAATGWAASKDESLSTLATTMPS